MKRAVVTGIGVVSPIGNNAEDVTESLRNCRPGIRFREEYEALGMRSRVAGSIEICLDELIERKQRRFMGDAAGYAHVAMQQAIADAGLTDAMLSSERTGLVAASGGASSSDLVAAADLLRNKGIRRVGPYRVTQAMGSTVSACLATAFRIKGVNYSITSACATSTHCIGHALELVQLGKQDLVFAGGGEEEHWTLSALFDAMGALSSNFNATPAAASRAYDRHRDGFVIAGGGGMLVVEELEHARARGARIYAEIVGYGATSDGFDMVAPSGEGAERAMRMALGTVNGRIDYINTHGTSTPTGDIPELDAIERVFGKELPPISSTKSLTGHSLGAAGVHEAIYTLLMMRAGFICESANIQELDPEVRGRPVVRKRLDGVRIARAMSNSFGFGGTNGVLVFEAGAD